MRGEKRARAEAARDCNAIAWPRDSWLGRQGAAFADALLEHAERVQVDGECIILPTQERDCGLFGVASGHVDIRLDRGRGSARLLDIEGPGFWCGRCTDLAISPTAVSVSSREATTVVRVAADVVARLIRDRPEARCAFVDLVIEHADAMVGRLTAATETDPRARVATKLLAATKGAPDGVVPVTQQDLAEMTGLSRSTVNRLLADLASTGVLKLGYRRLVVADRAALARVTASPPRP